MDIMMLARLLRLLPLLLALAGCATADGPNADDTDASVRQLYQEARAAMRSNNHETAIERLETLQARYPFGDYARQAQLDIIYLYYQTEEWEAALSAADRFMRLNPTHPRVDYALYMRASVNMARGRDFVGRLFDLDRAVRSPQSLRRAITDFRRLVAEFPDSDYAQDGRERLVVLRNLLAQHELAVARFYQKRSAHVAAANRAKTIIEDFQETPAVEQALEILADAYLRLDLPELRQDILRVIRRSHPDHPLAKQAG
jgi:outer membrane protein assembly factor BamD